MAEKKIMWETEDGKVFNMQSEADAHEFAVYMGKQWHDRGKSGDPYDVFKWLYDNRHLMDSYMMRE